MYLHRCRYDDSAVSKYEIHQAENLDYNRETLSQIFLPGSGMAARLLAVCREEGRLQAIILSKFCEEGDNTRDGLELADYSNQVLVWAPDSKYRAPHSWKLLFGPPPPTQMFW